MLNCRKITELCSQELERRLDVGERVSMHTHLMMCTGCTNFRQQLKFLRRVAKEYADGRGGPAGPADTAPDSGGL
jgi:hypothetical protein